MSRRAEAGAVGLQLVLLTGIAAAVLLAVAASAGSVVAAAARAQDAADAGALAAARARVEAGSAETAARRAVGAHGGVLVACSCTGSVVTVTVTVPVRAPAARALGVVDQRATARATLVRPRGPRAAGRGRAPGRTLAARAGRSRELTADRIVEHPAARPAAGPVEHRDGAAGRGHRARPCVRRGILDAPVDPDRVPAGRRPSAGRRP